MSFIHWINPFQHNFSFPFPLKLQKTFSAEMEHCSKMIQRFVKDMSFTILTLPAPISNKDGKLILIFIFTLLV